MTTSAPRRASSWVAYGSACICSAASTRTPSSGLPNCRRVRVGDVSEPHARHCRTVAPDGGSGPCDEALRRLRPNMRGILSAGGYVPYRRLQRSEIAADVRERRRQGHPVGRVLRRGHDHDGRRGGPRWRCGAAPDGDPGRRLWFATADPAYLDKTNATAIHAALRLDSRRAALDLGGAARSGVGALRVALEGVGTTLVVDVRPAHRAADRSGRVGRRRRRGRAARRRRRRPVRSSPSTSARASATEEFLDRWRTPGDRRSKVWEERFGETKYVPLGEQAWNARARRRPQLTPDAGRPGGRRRACTPGPSRALAKRLGAKDGALVDDLAATVGNTGAAHAGLAAGERARAGRAGRGHRARRPRRRRRRAAVPHHRRDRPGTGRPRAVAAQVELARRPRRTASSSRGGRW